MGVGGCPVGVDERTGAVETVGVAPLGAGVGVDTCKGALEPPGVVGVVGVGGSLDEPAADGVVKTYGGTAVRVTAESVQRRSSDVCGSRLIAPPIPRTTSSCPASAPYAGRLDEDWARTTPGWSGATPLGVREGKVAR